MRKVKLILEDGTVLEGNLSAMKSLLPERLFFIPR